MRAPISILSKHIKAYVESVVGDNLRREGFINRNGNGTDWHRVLNGEVYQALFFRPVFSYLPIMLQVHYCCHPLYIEPFFPQNLKSPIGPPRSIEAAGYTQTIIKRCGESVYSPEIAVRCPSDEYKGKDMIMSCVELLNSISTAEACYMYHKQDYYRVAQEQNWTMEYMFLRRLSVDFIEEAVFYNDQDVFPYCLPWINQEFERYALFRKVRRANEYEEAVEFVLKKLNRMFLDGTRDEYLDYLKQRQEENISLLYKKIKQLQL